MASSLRLIAPMSQRKKQRKARRVSRSTSIETLESRIVMSADPLLGPLLGHHAINDAPSLSHHDAAVFGGGLGHAIVESAPVHDAGADFWINSDIVLDDDDLGEQIDQTLYDAHDLTNQDEVVNKYGFDGSGQTVVVIDSGIAYNHYALGGGLGSGYRVVGGWDFTENDADPYDDGPEGAHGTHVAGIIGAQGDGQHSGVATGVDLVGLRVFDDAGNGYFSWVEQALAWVHTNKDSFNSPITAVNLSLGTDWNSASIPSWAMLENEFAALEADGIFISVSAGNSFTSYNTQGLSYPAASSHVIPVMSVDNDGSLSYFSQRAENAIAAPGRWITSTVPDYAANDGDTIDDDWLSMSGTSMAAPYMAGASALVRQAMDFAGQTNIDQWDIYDHMMATADSFYDSATSATYKRLNLEAAIDALMPTDDYGSTVALAHSLGTLTDSLSVSGTIALLDDVDYFTFTADVAGTVSMSVGVDHGLEPEIAVVGESGSWSGDIFSFDVVAGQTYVLSIETADGYGLGHYDADLSLEASEVGPPVTIKSVTTQKGVVYSLDSENWLSINGNRLWSGTEDFSVATNQHFFWQGTSGILQRFTDGGWSTMDRDAVKHEVTSNSLVYSLGADNVVSINGNANWGGTHDFHIGSDDAIYWHSVNGSLQKLPNGGPWQSLDTGVNEFAVRSDGAAFALTTDGNVTVDGVQTWSGISDLRLDDNGQLILVDNIGGLSYQAGSFTLSNDLGMASTQSVVLDSTGGDVATSSFAALASTELTRDFAGTTQVGGHTTATPLAERVTTASQAAKSELRFAAAYSQEVLLEEEAVEIFGEETEELASLEAIDSLFAEFDSFV